MRNMFIRAVKTFVAAFIPVLTAGLSLMAETDFQAWKTVLLSTSISGAAAGITAVMNLPAVREFLNDYGEK